MRINHERKTVDMEARDLNFIMPAYIRSYQYYMKGEDPKEIIFPMFPSALSASGVWIPIRYIEPTSSLAEEIAKDGSDVPDVTPEEEEKLDTKDEKIAKLEKEVVELGANPAEVVTEETAEKPDRQPKMPAGGDIGPGTHPDSMGSRDIRADRQVARDLKEEPAVEEDKEIPAKIEKPPKQ